MKRFLLIVIILCLVGVTWGAWKLRSYVIATTQQSTYAKQEPYPKKLWAYYHKVFDRSSIYEFLRRSYYMFGIPKTGDSNGSIVLHKTSNGGDSSSILPLKKHLLHYPAITEIKQLTVPQKRLDDYLLEKDKLKYNVIVMDIQGAELIALKGSLKTLENIDAIITETNYDELYEGAVLVHALDDFLQSKGFTRVDSISAAFYTGDALYIKNKFLKSRAGKNNNPA